MQPAGLAQQAQGQEKPASPGLFLASVIAIFVLAGTGVAYSALVTRVMNNQPPVVLSIPDIAGWQNGDAFTDWKPEFKNPAAEQMRFLQRDGAHAGVYIGYYRNQGQNTELIHHGNALATPEGQSWRRLSESSRTIEGSHLDVRQNQLAHGQQRLLGWYWYWVGDRFTTSSYVAKAYLALNRLLLRRDDSAVVAVFSPYTEGPASAAETLQSLLQDALPAVRQQLQEARQH
jgi:EpsI family protein